MWTVQAYIIQAEQKEEVNCLQNWQFPIKLLPLASAAFAVAGLALAFLISRLMLVPTSQWDQLEFLDLVHGIPYICLVEALTQLRSRLKELPYYVKG